MVVVGGFFVGAVLFAQLAQPLHTVFDPLQVKKFVSVRQLFSPNAFEGVPTKAPELALTTIEGRRFTLKELSSQNQLVVINFWASWCRPCIEEMPHIEKVHRTYGGKKVAFLGIAIRDSDFAVRRFVAQEKITYDIALDEEDKITTAFGGVGTLPTTIFIDSKNNIAKVHRGYMDQQQLEGNLKSLLER